MASKVVKNTSLGNIINRSFAAQAAAATQHSYVLPAHDFQVTKIKRGSIVISCETNSPVSRLAVFVKSGPKYETPEHEGVAHLARLSAGLASKDFSYFGATVRTMQMGGNMICQSGREHMAYSMNFIRDNLNLSMDLLGSMVLKPRFCHWEVDDLKPRLLCDLAARTPVTRTMELLHKAAFRETGLGKSLFVPDHRIGKVTSEEVSQFFQDTHTAERLAFVGLGMDHNALVKFAKQGAKVVPQGEGISGAGAYGGGEIRHQIDCPLAYVAVATQGAKLNSEEAVALALAQQILGSGSGVKYGSNAGSKLTTALTAAGGRGSVASINANYIDSGLFGFFLVEEPDKVASAVKALVKTVRTLKVTEADLQIAKARLRAAILMGMESPAQEIEEIGMQALFTGTYVSPTNISEAVDKVTMATVKAALTNVTKGKVSMASYGNVHNVPYVDQL